jgi:hypothetical protein
VGSIQGRGFCDSDHTDLGSFKNLEETEPSDSFGSKMVLLPGSSGIFLPFHRLDYSFSLLSTCDLILSSIGIKII